MTHTNRQRQGRGEASRLLPRLANLCVAGVGLVTILTILVGPGPVSPQSGTSESLANVTLADFVTTFALQANELHAWAAATLVAVVLLVLVRLTLGPAAWANDGRVCELAQA